MRLWFALLLCRLTRALLRLLGRGGTSLPGRLALAVYPKLLERTAAGVAVVMVTGTNGKTTTARMLEQMLLDAGCDCMANRSGSNLKKGIAADLAENYRLLRGPKKKYAVIECDEAAFRTVCGALKPKAVVVTNLFRDQLDRYGEVTHTLESIRAGLEGAPAAVLCYNADCPLCASLSALPNPARPFGMDAALEEASRLSDVPRCPACGGAYEYRWHTFAHLGGWRCRGCGRARPTPAVTVSKILEPGAQNSRAVFTAEGRTLEACVSLPGTYNLYNAAAALAAAGAMGIAADTAAASLARVESGFGRMERFALGDTPVTMILVKNPVGCDRAMDYVASAAGEKLVIFCLNDLDADGRDVSWIWDAGFERLAAAGAVRFAVSGTRAEDLRLRLKYAGAAEENIAVVPAAELPGFAAQSPRPVYILPTYTAMLPLRGALAARTGKKEFWK